MFKYSVFFEFILKSCKLVSYICLVFLFAILFKVNKCGMNVLSVAYDTEELTTPRFYVSLYTQTMRPHLFHSHTSEAKQKPHSSLSSCSASWYWIMNLKGNLGIARLTVFPIWNQTEPGHWNKVFSVICIWIMLGQCFEFVGLTSLKTKRWKSL